MHKNARKYHYIINYKILCIRVSLVFLTLPYFYIFYKPNDIVVSVCQWTGKLVFKRLKNLYLMHPCLTLSFIRYEPTETISAPSSTPQCSNYLKGSLRESLDYIYIYIYIYNYNVYNR